MSNPLINQFLLLILVVLNIIKLVWEVQDRRERRRAQARPTGSDYREHSRVA